MSLKRFTPTPREDFHALPDSVARWNASRQHFELEKLRVEDPERYHMIYPSALRMWQQRQDDYQHQ